MRYHYDRCDNGQTVEVVMTIAEMLRREKKQRDGRHAIMLTRAEVGESGPGKRVRAFRNVASEIRGFSSNPGTWPLVSRAAGVNKHQIKEAAADLANAGIQTDFTPSGEIVFRDNAHRNKVLQHLGMFDQQASYGQRAPSDPRNF